MQERYGGWLSSVALAPDARYLAVGYNGTLLVSEISAEAYETGNVMHARKIWSQGVRPPINVTFSQNGKYLAAMNRNSEVRLWKTADWSEIASRSHSKVAAVAFSPDANQLFTAGGSEIQTWELAHQSQPNRWNIDHATHFAFAPGASILAAADTAQVWMWQHTSKSTPGWFQVARFAHQGRLTSIAISPDAQTIASGSEDGTARLWNPGGRELTRMAHGDRVTAVAFGPDGKYLATGGGNSIQLWEPSGGYDPPRLAHDSAVKALAFAEGGLYLATASENGSARIWQAPGLSHSYTLKHDIPSPLGPEEDARQLHSIALSRNGRYLATLVDKELVKR
jgi:WD40 repeat protein